MAPVESKSNQLRVISEIMADSYDPFWEQFVRSIPRLSSRSKKRIPMNGTRLDSEISKPKLPFSYAVDSRCSDSKRSQDYCAHSLKPCAQPTSVYRVQEVPPSYFRSFSIQRVLDLHGQTIAQSEVSLCWFFQNAQDNQIQAVRVVTGKGIAKTDCTKKGVLQAWIREWFQKNPQFVVCFSHATLQQGGSGAFYVHVRKPKRFG
jgi:DNA-nicking Smr family endonuclease